LCGAIFLDEMFEKKLEGWIGKRRLDSLSARRRRQILLEDWERKLKRDFDGAEQSNWEITVPQEWKARPASKRGFIKNLFKKTTSELPIGDSVMSIPA
jgi:hypothetical protein